MPYYGSDYSSDYDEGEDEDEYMEDHNQSGIASSRNAVTNGPTDYEHNYKGELHSVCSRQNLYEISDNVYVSAHFRAILFPGCTYAIDFHVIRNIACKTTK